MSVQYVRQVLPLITCAVCGKYVDRVEVMRNFADRSVGVKVWCHGDTDEMKVDEMIVAEFGEDQFREGTAFTTRRIEV
jgi:hypothetical protein